MRRICVSVGAIASLCVGSGVALGGTITVSGSSGSLSATARFENSGGNLVVTLTNNSSADVLVPADILTAVFFNVISGETLTPVSALLSGSVVHFGSNGGGNVGGEWGYAAGIGGPGGATRGISSSGFGLFGSSNFNGPDLDPPDALNGLNYGLTSTGDNVTTGNAPVTGGVPLIQDHVVFTLSGISAMFDPAASIRNVSFQYGTALTEPNVPGTPNNGMIPLPSASVLGLAGIGIMASRRRRGL
ncbi:MAG: XDD4 family exosortase-dependent surface protein [Phycisphaerales bacterium]